MLKHGIGLHGCCLCDARRERGEGFTRGGDEVADENEAGRTVLVCQYSALHGGAAPSRAPRGAYAEDLGAKRLFHEEAFRCRIIHGFHPGGRKRENIRDIARIKPDAMSVNANVIKFLNLRTQ